MAIFNCYVTNYQRVPLLENAQGFLPVADPLPSMPRRMAMAEEKGQAGRGGLGGELRAGKLRPWSGWYMCLYVSVYDK